MKIIDSNKNSIIYSYDNLNRKIKHFYPSRKYKKFFYDKNSNQIKIIKEDFTIIEKEYDNLNRHIKTFVDNDENPVQEFKYDEYSRLKKAIDYNEGKQTNEVRYTYDDLHNIDTSIQNGLLVDSTYNKNSNLTDLKIGTIHIKNEYKNKLLEKVFLNNQEVSNFKYNDDNRVNTINNANGVKVDLEYDGHSREENREYSSNIYTQKTIYDGNSNIVREEILKLNSQIIKDYKYDNLNRIIKDEYNKHEYKYNDLNNIIFTNQNGYEETRVPNKDNEYTSITNRDIRYDVNGNLIKYQNKEYKYDYLNRLTTVKKDGVEIVKYYYDALNRRVQKVLEDKTIRYIYHKNRVIQEYENDSLTSTYIYGQGIDDILAYSYNNNLYYYIKDRIGSIVAITNQEGIVVESYSYNIFGIISIKDQDGQDILKSKLNNSYSYTGRRLDSESGLYYYRNRMYDASLGRFLSKDPLGYVDGLNLYAYVMNNPLRFIDPMGTAATMETYSETPKPYNKEELTGFSKDFITRIFNNGVTTIREGINLVIKAPSLLLSGGGYLAEVSGFRDWKDGSSIVDDFFQNQALDEAISGFEIVTSESFYVDEWNLLQKRFDESPGSVAADVAMLPLSIFTVNKLAGVAKVGDNINNPLPINNIFSRAMPNKYAEDFISGDGTIGKGEVFIGAAEDISDINNISGLQKRLSLFEDVGGNKPRLDSDTIVEFKLEDSFNVGLRSPIETIPSRGYGFLEGGRTEGGVREWLINNGTASEIGAYDINIRKLEKE